MRELQECIDQLKTEAEQAKRLGDLTRASELTYGALPGAQGDLEKAKARLGERNSDLQLLREEVTEDDIARVVASWTGIPVDRLREGERDKLVEMEVRMGARVVGQKDAIIAVSNAIRRARAGLQDENRPIGSFMFLDRQEWERPSFPHLRSSFLMTRVQRSGLTCQSIWRSTPSRLIGAPPDM